MGDLSIGEPDLRIQRTDAADTRFESVPHNSGVQRVTLRGASNTDVAWGQLDCSALLDSNSVPVIPEKPDRHSRELWSEPDTRLTVVQDDTGPSN